MSALLPFIELLARLFMAAFFVFWALEWLFAISVFEAVLRQLSLPIFLSYPLVLLMIVAALALFLGYRTRMSALFLVVLVVIYALWVLPWQQASARGDALLALAVAGGLLQLVCNGAGRLSVDGKR
jgi:putative oxidoreductase